MSSRLSGKRYVPPLQFSPATGAKKIEATELIRRETLRMSNLTSNIIEVEDSLEAVNDWFCREKLSDGLPIVPPTPERVERMLDGTQARSAGSHRFDPTEMGACDG